MKNAAMKLNLDELVKAAGGDVAMGDHYFSDYVDGQYAVPGQDYFIVFNDGRNWSYGTLLDNSEQDVFGCRMDRHYNFQLHRINEDWKEVPARYKASDVTLYRNCLTLATGRF